MRRTSRWIIIATAVPVVAVAFYFAAALILGLIAIGTASRAPAGGIDVYVQTNGVHADLIVPVAAAGLDWRDSLPLDTIRSGVSPGGYLALGWGDRGFYLSTPRWTDLRLIPAISALAGLDATVMHVEALAAAPLSGPRRRHVRLAPEEYRRLAAFVMTSFAVDVRGAAIIVPSAHLGNDDAFLEARGRYSLLVTCNEWTRRALAEASVRVPVWSPFDTALMFRLPED